MAEPRKTSRVRLETKVMVAVLTVLVALPTITVWLVDRNLREQVQRDADLALSTARASFLQAMQTRNAELAGRFRISLRDPAFRQILRLNDSATLENHLTEYVLVEMGDTELAFYVKADGVVFAKARAATAPTVSFDNLAAAADGLIRNAFQGDVNSQNLVVDGRVFDVVAFPVNPTGGVEGVAVFAIPFSNSTLKQIRPPGSEILVLINRQVAASTWPNLEQADGVVQQLAERASHGSDDSILVGGARFRPATGTLDAASAEHGVRYVVLSSIEQRMSAFERTRRALIGVSAAGILISAAIVWFFVRRITRPLVQLRNTAEAVGRGDFSHRIERFSNDECGDLAETFNQMTFNLQMSRAELERAMQQVRTTQEQLIQSEKLSAVGQFVAGVAHELNNPLTAVVGFSELLQSSAVDEKTRGFLDRIAKSAHRCHKIVHSLLSFARQHPPERKLVDLHVVMDEVLEIMTYDLRTSNIVIVREFEANLPQVMADPHQLQQVLVNIIGNARQAIEPFQREGRIVLRTRHENNMVTIELQDNGPGIKLEHLARIFDPFFTTKPVGKGTGLGLSLCYGLIQEHGGKIYARSAPGQGATFAIELPVAKHTPSALIAHGGSVSPFPMGGGTPSGKTVLVIDDEAWILELAAELLKAEGHNVDTAQGGTRAMELLSGKSYDVIVSDWKMPGLNGIRLFEHLQSTDPTAAKRVLFMTGDVVNDTFQNFLRDHELTCLSKPFARGEFRSAVARLVGAA